VILGTHELLERGVVFEGRQVYRKMEATAVYPQVRETLHEALSQKVDGPLPFTEVCGNGGLPIIVVAEEVRAIQVAEIVHCLSSGFVISQASGEHA
jgi:hypothetical protein